MKLKSAIKELLVEGGAEVEAVTTRYFFRAKTKKEKAICKNGDALQIASVFLHAAKGSGLNADYYCFNENGTGVEVTEVP